jgi:hypothetical protein
MRVKKKTILGIVVAIAIVFIVFAPVIQVPHNNGLTNGPRFAVYVSVSHYAFGFGGMVVHNMAGTEYDYSVDV